MTADKDLAILMHKLAKNPCAEVRCPMFDGTLEQASVEIGRLRVELERQKMERATLIAINSRLADEMEALEARLPHKFLRRWVSWLRGGDRG